LVATHVATAIVLLGFFRKDWARIIFGVLRSLKEREIKESDSDAKLGWLLVVGTIPAGVLGLLLEDNLRSLFASARSAAFFLILNGFLLFAGEFLRRKAKEFSDLSGSDKRIAKLSFFQAFKVGLLQSIALIPGFSRTGATLVGSLLVGLSHEDSARFSFLLATPVIGAAALLKLPELLSYPDKQIVIASLFGALTAGISAYFTVRFLIKYFKSNTLIPFAGYCLIAGGVISLALLR
jgi:undecaprenyl-diphosphatase